jgi:hypothetical protein
MEVVIIGAGRPSRMDVSAEYAWGECIVASSQRTLSRIERETFGRQWIVTTPIGAKPWAHDV